MGGSSGEGRGQEDEGIWGEIANIKGHLRGAEDSTHTPH